MSISKYKKEIEKGVRQITDRSFTITTTSKQRFKIEIDGLRPFYTGVNPSDNRAKYNILADIKREFARMELAVAEHVTPKGDKVAVIKKSRRVTLDKPSKEKDMARPTNVKVALALVAGTARDTLAKELGNYDDEVLDLLIGAIGDCRAKRKEEAMLKVAELMQANGISAEDMRLLLA